MGCRNYDICYIDFMLPFYRHHPFCLICNVLTMICKRQFINTRIFFTFTTFFLKRLFFLRPIKFYDSIFVFFCCCCQCLFLELFAHYSFLLSCCCRTVFILSFSLFVTLFFFLLYFLITLLPCFLCLFLFWKRFSDSGISFVNNVFSSSPYIRRPNGNYFLAFTI